MRLADDCCYYRTWCNASVLVLRILFRLIIVVCMLLELFQTTTVDTEPNQDIHGWRFAVEMLRLSHPVRCVGARLENFISVDYSDLHAPRNISDHHCEHQAKPRHAWHAAR
jgi:hypothetical protein